MMVEIMTMMTHDPVAYHHDHHPSDKDRVVFSDIDIS